jgi:predicted nucleic acid-binding protein
VKPLSALPAGTHVFVDTNIFVFYYTYQGELQQASREFLKRTASDVLHGFTSALVAAEVIHRVLVAEAAEQLALSSRETIEYLQKHPQLVKQLTRHLAVPSDMRRMGMDILPLTHQELHRSKAIRSTSGLLTNDSLMVATMQRHKIADLATNDTGFARVAGRRVWRPEH